MGERIILSPIDLFFLIILNIFESDAITGDGSWTLYKTINDIYTINSGYNQTFTISNYYNSSAKLAKITFSSTGSLRFDGTYTNGYYTGLIPPISKLDIGYYINTKGSYDVNVSLYLTTDGIIDMTKTSAYSIYMNSTELAYGYSG